MTTYVVLKLAWEYNDSWHDMDREVPLKAFLSHDDALASQEELERQERANYEARARGDWFRLSGFFSGDWSNLTTRSEQEIDDWLQAHDLPVRPKTWEGTRYRIGATNGWKEELAAALIGQNVTELFWELADRVRFYEVVEIEIEE